MTNRRFELYDCPSFNDQPVFLVIDSENNWWFDNYGKKSDLIAMKMCFEPSTCYRLVYGHHDFVMPRGVTVIDELLHRAANIGHAQLVMFLLECGANPCSTTIWKQLPVDHALRHDHEDTLLVLVSHMALVTDSFDHQKHLRQLGRHAWSNNSYESLGVLYDFLKLPMAKLHNIARKYRVFLRRSEIPKDEIDSIIDRWWLKRSEWREA